jgi:GGDEF domain-containing protein
MDELEKERRRLREANARFGMRWRQRSTRAAPPVIVESAVEATHADGASSSPRTARSSRPATSAPAAHAGLRAQGRTAKFGRLLLVGEEFDVEERMIAARSPGRRCGTRERPAHQMVERQALVDGLTGLANWRQADASLATELTRAERLAAPSASSWPTSTTSSS